HPKLVGQWIEGKTEGVAYAISEILGEIPALSKERIVAGNRSIGIDSQDHRGVVRRRPVGKILQAAVPVQIADHDIKFAIGSESYRSAVVIRSRVDGQFENQKRRRQSRAIPGVAVNAIRCRGAGAIAACSAFGVVEINE